MYRWIDWFGVIWFFAGLLALGIGALPLLTGNITGMIIGAIAALVCFTVGLVLQGFAVIVRYFERANRKQK